VIDKERYLLTHLLVFDRLKTPRSSQVSTQPTDVCMYVCIHAFIPNNTYQIHLHSFHTKKQTEYSIDRRTMDEKKIPAFTVLKDGSIYKNIFLLGKQSESSRNQESDGQMYIVGRHPDCHITLHHPSISKYHLCIESTPSLHMISVVDLSSGK
jgi:hypothetical protein